MANCCEEIPCNRLATIGDMHNMVSLASSELDCTDYISGGTVYYPNGCYDDYNVMNYCPTSSEILDSLSEYGGSPLNARGTSDKTELASKNPIYFQTWSQASKAYYSSDGFYIKPYDWGNPTCCSGDANIPISALTFSLTKYSGMIIPNTTNLDPCEDRKNIDFNYSINIVEVNGCDNYSITTANTIVLNNTNFSSNDYGDIISAICINEQSQTDIYSAFTDFNYIDIGNIRISKAKLFTPEIVNDYFYDADNDGISAITYSANAYIHIVPKFRGCSKDPIHCNVSRNGTNNIFNWDETNCVSSDNTSYFRLGALTSDTVSLEDAFSYVEVYRGDTQLALRSTEYQGSYIVNTYAEPDYGPYDPNLLYLLFIENSGTFELQYSFPRNDSETPNVYKVKIKLPLCSQGTKETEHTVCQDGKTDATRGTCCTGLISLFSSIDCGDDEGTISNKTKEIREITL